MYISKSELLKKIKPNDKVLDIGSWNEVFGRADYVIDINPYETRNNSNNETENFSKRTWLVGDVNDQSLWDSIEDNFFDFSVCSHLLEDIRDPIMVCKNLIKKSKRGYIEVPSKWRELSKIESGKLCSGYDHHRWLVDIVDDTVIFTAKLHWANMFDYLSDSKREYLNHYNFHFIGFFWDENFSFKELCPKGERLQFMNIMYEFDNFDLTKINPILQLKKCKDWSKNDTLLYVDKFKLPIENESPEVFNSYEKKYKNICLKEVNIFKGFFKYLINR